MAFLDNNPTNSYVKCSNLSIIYNNMSYEIQNIYTSHKYLYWDLKTPNVLIETNIRPTESSSKFLVCINERGIHTEVPHDELVYNFGVYSAGEISQGEFNSLKVKVDDNTTKYNTISRTVDGVTEIIGKEEVLEDGSIIKNLNTVKKTAGELSARVEQITTEYADDFKDIRNKISDKLVSLLTSISTMHTDFSTYSNDGKLESEEKTQLTTDISSISSSLTDLTTIVTELITLLDNNNQDNYVTRITASLENVKTSVNLLVSFATTSISDDEIVSSEITIVTQSVGEASKCVNILKADCDEIMLLGLGGTIYDQFAQLKLLNDRFQTTVKEIKYSTTNSLSAERSKAYSQIEDLTSVTDAFYNLINSLSTTSNLNSVEVAAVNSAKVKITTEYTELMTLSNTYEASVLLSDVEKQNFVNKGIILTNKYNTLLASVTSMLTDSYMNSSEKNTILTNTKLLLDSIGVYNNDLSEVILLIESYKFTSKIEETKKELNDSINNLNNSMNGLVDFTNGTFVDNFVDQVELKNLKNDLAKLTKEKTEIDEIYTSIKSLSNEYANFTNAYNDLTTEYNLIIAIMNKYTTTGKTPTEEDKNNINIGYNNISKKLETFIKEGYEVNKRGVTEINASSFNTYTNSKDILISSLNDFSNNCSNLFQNYYLTTSEKDMFNTLFELSNVSIQEYVSKINDYIRSVFVSEVINQDTSNYYVNNYNEINDLAFNWENVCEFVINKNFIVGEEEINNIQNEKNIIELKFAKFNALNMSLCSNLTYDFVNSYNVLLKLFNNLNALNSDTGIISSEIDSELVASMGTTEIVNNYTNFISTHVTGLDVIHNSYLSKYAEITTLVNNIVANVGGDMDSYIVLLSDLLSIMCSYINSLIGYICNTELTLEQLNAYITDLYALHKDIESQTYNSLTYIKSLYSNVMSSFIYITTSDASVLTSNLTDVNTNPVIWLNSKVLSSGNVSSLNISNFKSNYKNLKSNITNVYNLFGDDFQIEGRNLLQNTDFKKLPPTYEVMDGITYKLVSDDRLQISTTDSYVEGNCVKFKLTRDIQPNETLTISFKGKPWHSFNTKVRFKMSYGTWTNWETIGTAGVDAYYSKTFNVGNIKDNSWLWVEFGYGCTILPNTLKVEIGIVTPWTPAPEDEGKITDSNTLIVKYNQLLSEITNLINTETNEVVKNKYILRKQEFQTWRDNAITDKNDFNESIQSYNLLLDEFISMIDSIYIAGTYLSENSYLNQNTSKVKFSEDISNLSKLVGHMINTISKYLEYSNRNLLEIETISLQSVINLSKITMEDIFVDSYLTDSEKILMTQNLKKVETDKVNVETAYLSLMSNKYVVDENRNNLVKAYEFYCQQYLSVVDIINSFLVKVTMMVSSDNEALNQAMNDYNEAISSFNTTKDIAISEAYKNEAEKYSEKSIESNMTQLSNAFNFTFDNVEKKVVSENDKLVETLTKFQTYVKIIQGEDNKPHVILGKTGNTDDAQFKIDISNEKMSFLQNDVEVAYVKYDKFRITNGEILDSLKIGSFAFEPDFDGGVTFKYKGGE
ncbi:MAG: hypothetical protein E6356_17210 [Terrisporobacter othiniensis]|nr:hypothetical protein [Terrisporobacter othiniensis]